MVAPALHRKSDKERNKHVSPADSENADAMALYLATCVRSLTISVTTRSIQESDRSWSSRALSMIWQPEILFEPRRRRRIDRHSKTFRNYGQWKQTRAVRSRDFLDNGSIPRRDRNSLRLAGTWARTWASIPIFRLHQLLSRILSGRTRCMTWRSYIFRMSIHCMALSTRTGPWSRSAFGGPSHIYARYPTISLLVSL